MSQRLDTSGHMPIVEYRSSVDRYFVVYEDLGVELAPVFCNRWSAHDVAVNAYFGCPFFMMIPTVPYGTSYPRPNTIVPKIRELDIKLRIR